MTYPIDAVVAITYRCQARCRMCSVWQVSEHDDVPPDLYKKLPETLRDVNISGGEPFLRKDLEEIVSIVHGRVPKARIIVSTNAFMGKAIIPRAVALKKIVTDIGFGVSVDGVGKMHDHIRGIDGAFDKILAVVKGLKEQGIENIRLAFTLTTENSDHMLKVYELAGELGVQFTMQVSHDSEFFFGENESTVMKRGHPHFAGDTLRRDFETIINGELSSYHWKRMGRAFIFYGTYKLAVEGEQLLTTRPGVDYFYLDPSGNVYPSVLHNYVMGNLTETEFATLWRSRRADEARRSCLEDSRPYWLGCTLRKALLDHKYRVGAWILKNKLFKVKL